MSCVSTADVLVLNKAHVSRVSIQICPAVQSQDKGKHRGGERPKVAPPLWRRPQPASFVLAVNIGHILVLRRKTCALLRAQTSALLRRKTSAVLRASTRALFSSNTKLTFCFRFPTFCSAHGSPRSLESPMLEISDVLFCAQESQNS